jgi:cyanophycinase
MARLVSRALIPALIALAACDPPSNDDLRVIVSSGPVYEVPARDAPPVKPLLQPAGRGTMVLEGGGVYLEQASELTVALAGPKPVLCLIDTAAKGGGDPYLKFDKIGGFRMLTVNVTAANAQQVRVIEALESCSGYFFNGGNPLLLSTAFRPNAEDSRALKVIRQRYSQKGAVIAGTSAGAMIVGDLTLCECGSDSSVEALSQGKLFEAPGYAFVHGVLIDAHFFARGLLGRHLYALADTREPLGVGIDESTAVIVPGDGAPWKVIGDSSVALIRRGKLSSVDHLRDFTISLLNAGDSFDPATGRIIVAPGRKLVPLARDPGAAPVETAGIFEPDRVRSLILELARSPSLSAKGYDDSSGMVVDLQKTASSAAYSGGGATSVLELGLSIARR